MHPYSTSNIPIYTILFIIDAKTNIGEVTMISTGSKPLTTNIITNLSYSKVLILKP